MTASSEIVGVIAGVALVLLAATVVGRTLAFWPGPQESNATVANLNARLDAWWMMLALIALAFAFGRRGVIVLFAILSFAALREFMGRVRAAGFRQRRLREAARQHRRAAQGDRDFVFQGSRCRLGETGNPDRPQGRWQGSVWPVGHSNQRYGKPISAG